MPDYDVQALALAVPPASAPVASYYPAVSVRNNGIHPAPVTGTLRIHDKAAGTLVATLALLSTSNLNPGATASVPATTAWSPTTSDIGKQYLFSAEVKSPLDEVPGNNQLSPVTVLVTAEPPAPPPVTVRHALQHEHDGADEIDVSGLPGVLASGQYPKPHKYTHGIDGDDMLNVDGLPGELHDSQPALAHGNERHTAAYTTEGALTAHNNSQAAHANSANLEHTAAKGAASGYAALDASTRVPKDQLGTGQGTTGEFLRGDRTWAAPIATPSPHAATHQATGDDEISITGLSGKTADAQTPEAHKLSHQLLGDDQIAISGLIGNPAARDAASGLAPIDPFRWLPGRNLTPLTSVCNFPGTPGGLPINEPILPGASNPTVQTWIIYTPTTKVAGIFAHISANFTFPPLCPDYACHIEVRIEHGATLIDTKYARYSLKLGGSCSLFDHVIPLSLVVAMHTDLDSDYQMTVRYWNDTAATTITVEQTGVVIGHASASEPPV